MSRYLYVGVWSGYTYVVPLKNKAYAYTALQDFIRQVGAPSFIAVDAAREENLGEWLSVCRTYCISQRTSEPNYQNQNRVERRIQDIKRRARILMSIDSTPNRYWDHAIEYAMDLINHTVVRRLNWRTPYELIFRDTPDISVFCFIFYEPVHYLEPNVQFPKANMLPGRFLGIARMMGDTFTFIITTDDGIKSIALHHRVIRKRDSNSKDPYTDYNAADPVETEVLDEQTEGSQNNGKLYILVRWENGQESYISAELLQSDDPVRLAKFIRDKPVE